MSRVVHNNNTCQAYQAAGRTEYFGAQEVDIFFLTHKVRAD